MNVIGPETGGLPEPRLYELQFRDSRVETPTSMTFRFSTVGTGLRYLSNQAVRIAIPGLEDPWGPVRVFSLSSSPSNPTFIWGWCASAQRKNG